VVRQQPPGAADHRRPVRRRSGPAGAGPARHSGVRGEESGVSEDLPDP
jgi:hypothetical protein